MSEESEDNQLEGLAFAVEVAALGIIAARLATFTEGTTYADARGWQAEDMAAIAAVLAKGSKRLTKATGKLYAQVAADADEWAAPYFAYRGKAQPKALEDVFLSQTVKAGREKATADVKGMCRTSVMRIIAPDGTERRMDEAYKAICDTAIQAIQRSERDYVTAITGAVRNLSRGGLRVRYASGETRELFAAVSMNVRDGVRQTSQDLRNQQAGLFGADGVEVSAHGMCAEDHLPYQGRQFTTAEFESIQDGLSRPIGKGCNCRHMYTGVILGVSSPAYTTAQVERMAEVSTRPTGFRLKSGRELNGYEFTQWQRAQETAIRRLKAESRLMERAGLDPSGVNAATADRLRAYKAASADVGIETRPERTRVYEWKL